MSGVCWRLQKILRKTRNTNVEIFYVVSVNIPGKILLEDQKVWQYGPDRNQGPFFCLFSRKKTIKAISVKVTTIVTG